MAKKLLSPDVPPDSDSEGIALVGLWSDPTNAIVQPGRIVGVTDYWRCRWLPILGWARWHLVTHLRWLYYQMTALGDPIEGFRLCSAGGGAPPQTGTVEISINQGRLAHDLGMTPEELRRLLAKEVIPGQNGSPRWCRLKIPPRVYKTQEAAQIEALRLFIPRLRQHSRRVGDSTVPLGIIIELRIDDIPTPEDMALIRAARGE